MTDNPTTADYRVKVTRAARVLSSDATLSAILSPQLVGDDAANPILLRPAFNKGVTAYTATVANSVREVAVSAMETVDSRVGRSETR